MKRIFVASILSFWAAPDFDSPSLHVDFSEFTLGGVTEATSYALRSMGEQLTPSVEILSVEQIDDRQDGHVGHRRAEQVADGEVRRIGLRRGDVGDHLGKRGCASP